MARIAIQLLPHLVEAVHRAGSIIVIGERAGGKLKRPGRKVIDVRDAGVRNMAGLPGPARKQILIVVRCQTVLGSLSIGRAADSIVLANVAGASSQRWRKN